MCNHRNPLHCILPPHILRALLASTNSTVRNSALHTVMLTAKLTAQRSFMPIKMQSLQDAVPSHGLQRTIFSQAGNFTQRVRTEGMPPVTDPAANEAYDGLGNTYTFYKTVFGRDSIDGSGLPLQGIVHYGQNYNNAFWDGQKMVFGDGDGVVFIGFTKALDVIAHELTHGVTQVSNGLEYQNQSGALNESISDVFGSMVKQYIAGQTTDKADWLIGSGILGPSINGVALRSMMAPGTAYNDPNLGGQDPQPGKMSDYRQMPNNEYGDNGGVHINSGIPNRAFYLTAAALGGHSWDEAGNIWYQSMKRIPSSASFIDFATVLGTVAGEIYGKASNWLY